jgi:transposase-like protein
MTALIRPFEPKYTEEQKRTFFEALKENAGNVAAAAKQAGVPVESGRYWVRKARKKGVSVYTRRRSTPDNVIRELFPADVLSQNWKIQVDAHLEHLLYKIIEKAEKSLKGATLPQQVESVRTLVTTLNMLRKQPKEPASAAPPPPPETTNPELKALDLLRKAEERRASQIEGVNEPSEAVS